MICTILECTNTAVCRGWCDKHYTRWKRHKDTSKTLQDMHGLSNTSEYWIYKKMIGRCSNPNQKYYHRYGGRGIMVCDRWLESFSNFLKDVGMRPSKLHEIDRIDNDGNYEPSNCKWTTRQEQMNNTSANHRVMYGGKDYTLAQLARKLDVSYVTLTTRINRGWDVERATSTPINTKYSGTG